VGRYPRNPNLDFSLLRVSRLVPQYHILSAPWNVYSYHRFDQLPELSPESGQERTRESEEELRHEVGCKPRVVDMKHDCE
jgi:hypothetical protein